MRIFRWCLWAAVAAAFSLQENIQSHGQSMVNESEDWSQWGGPRRAFSVPPLDGDPAPPRPELRWTRNLGKGHSAIVARGEFGYSLHLETDDQVLEKWRIDDGHRMWNFRSHVDYHASFPNYDGPHATPVVVNDRVIAASIDAQVFAVSVSDGNLIWRRDLRTDLGTRLPQSGYASSPIVWKNMVILPTLGEPQAAETETYPPSATLLDDPSSVPGAVAIDIQSGQEAWRTKSFRSSHSSPILVVIEGQPMLVFHGMFELIGIDPSNGEVLWRQLLRQKAADNVSFTPIWDSERSQFLISHGYCKFGTQAIKLEKAADGWTTTISWTNPRLQVVHTNAILIGHTLVGTKRPSATLLVAIDVRNGQTVFRERGYGKSNFVAVGDDFIILDENGWLSGARLEREKVLELWKIKALSNTAWTTPTMAGRWLLLRDSRQLKAFEFPRR